MKILITREGDAQRSLEVMGDSFEDLGPALNNWLKYFKVKTQADWPDKPEKKRGAGKVLSDEMLRHTADAALRRKLTHEYTRASRRYARGRGSARAMERRWAVLKEFERQAAGGLAAGKMTAYGMVAATNDARLEKSIAGLRKRHSRAIDKAQGKLLGRIAQSIRSKSRRYSAEVWSEVPWAGIHNKGGTAGHGSKIPKREFLVIEDHDLEVLKAMIEEHTRMPGT